jgi:hypothetical protein
MAVMAATAAMAEMAARALMGAMVVGMSSTGIHDYGNRMIC